MYFPLIVHNESSCQTLGQSLDWLGPRVVDFQKQLASEGAILFRGFPVCTAEDFDAFSAVFNYVDFTYQESLSNAVRINFTPRVFTANEAPPATEIFLHHEMAQTPISPEKLFFCCISAADQGGATPLCRSDLLMASFVRQQPKWAAMFSQKGLKYTTEMPGEDDLKSGQGRSWRSTLSVESKQEAEVKLKALGYSWRWQADDVLLATTPALPAVKELPDGSTAFYNQVVAAYFGWPGVKENPDDKLTFGDGSPIAPEILETVAGLAAEFTFDLKWQDGDVALVDNHRVMHGRRPYAGARKRQVLVSLARDAA